MSADDQGARSEQALDDYEGTLLLVTHDRRLLEALEITRTVDLGYAAGR